MPRAPKFSLDDLLDAAGRCVLAAGSTVSAQHLTVAQVAAEAGAPIGSFYHRFPSRDALFAHLWLRSVQRFHEGLYAATELPDPYEAMLARAVHIPRFCRAHPTEALAMTLYRQPVAVTLVDPTLRPIAETLNDRVRAELFTDAERHYGGLSERQRFLAMIACQQSPYGLVRPWCGQDVPEDLDEVVLAAAEAILRLGETG